jgi:hypothetical protein
LPTSDSDPRVVSFHRGKPVLRPPEPPIEDLSKYQQSDGPDDYRHRMIVNVLAFLFVFGLIGVGVWLADTMASMRKNQDCVLSGRRNCAPIEAPKDRW